MMKKIIVAVIVSLGLVVSVATAYAITNFTDTINVVSDPMPVNNQSAISATPTPAVSTSDTPTAGAADTSAPEPDTSSDSATVPEQAGPASPAQDAVPQASKDEAPNYPDPVIIKNPDGTTKVTLQYSN